MRLAIALVIVLAGVSPAFAGELEERLDLIEARQREEIASLRAKVDRLETALVALRKNTADSLLEDEEFKKNIAKYLAKHPALQVEALLRNDAFLKSVRVNVAKENRGLVDTLLKEQRFTRGIADYLAKNTRTLVEGLLRDDRFLKGLETALVRDTRVEERALLKSGSFLRDLGDRLVRESRFTRELLGGLWKQVEENEDDIKDLERKIK